MKKPRKYWRPRHDAKLLYLKDELGLTFAQIAKRLGFSPPTVTKHYKVLTGERESLNARREDMVKPTADPKPEKPQQIGIHLENYNRARRGFHVPAEKEDQYFDLLKTGIPIAEAARRLGLSQRHTS